MTRTWIALAATVAAGGIAAVASPFRAVTPGTLSPGHERHRDDCFACHAPFAGPARARCTRCHEPARVGLQAVDGRPLPAAARKRPSLAGLHTALAETECYRCHIEHSGTSRAIARLRFAHELLPPGVPRTCATCHTGERPADALHARADACEGCHTTTRWKPATFDHRKYFRFDADHLPRCADCHAPEAGFRTYSCTGCHEHSRARMIAEHREERITNIDACARCHRSGDEHDIVRDGAGGGERQGGEDGEEDDEDEEDDD